MGRRTSPKGLRDRRLLLLALVVVTAGGLVVGTTPSQADVSAVKGSAFGYTLSVSLFGGQPNIRGVGQFPCTSTNPPTPPGCAPNPALSDSPAVNLPPTGGNESQTDPEGPTAQVGPAIIFSSGAIDVSTQGTLGPNGSVTSTADIQNVNKSRQEVFTATSLSSSCTASEGGITATTEVIGGTVITSEGNPDVDGDEVTVAVPTNPAPGLTIPGVIEAVGDRFEYVFNEQITNPDGSITVYAAHMRLLGPTAIGDLYVGKSECGVTVTAGTTTTSTLPTTSTSSSIPTTSTSTSIPTTTSTSTSIPTTTSTSIPTTTSTSTSIPTTTSTSVVPPTTTSVPPSGACQVLLARRAAFNAQIDAVENRLRQRLSGPRLATALARLQAARAQGNAAFNTAMAARGCTTARAATAASARPTAHSASLPPGTTTARSRLASKSR
ncbi:MAG: hypothetical protein M3179_09590 [Actinomycetota bacterium]|nr:hypothetical protein [Actinomycetota bacterium]